MGNAYRIGSVRLTAMQNACYEYFKVSKGYKTINDVLNSVYENCLSGKTPDLWTPEEKLNNVTKWCNALVALKLVAGDGNGNFILYKNRTNG